MSDNDLYKQIMNSNIKDDVKIMIIKKLVKNEDNKIYPYYPYDPYYDPNKVWIPTIVTYGTKNAYSTTITYGSGSDSEDEDD